ncbi:MAG: HAMP domain-containing histidine kinase, partial [Minwuiales bacterium]|nr:HAMP domain-containing histidine kinase [Minwuiales bacterium]
ELRTPLNAIIGFADLVKMQPFGELNERYLDYIGEVSQAGRHLLSLINDCLDVARLEMDSLPLHVGRVQLKEVLRDARAMIALRAEGKGIDISKIGCDDDIILNVDPTRCFQIFVNLLSNGVKFTPDGGAIGVDIVAVEHKNAINVVVWDTGAGIPEESQDLIFDKFQQLHDDILSRVNEGVGLGLTLSRQFARLMGGNITVESTPGHGSRFSVQLPLAEPEES